MRSDAGERVRRRHCERRRWINPQWELRSRQLLSLTSHFCLGLGNLDNFYGVRARFKTAIASFNLSQPVITARTGLTQLENWSLLLVRRIFPWTMLGSGRYWVDEVAGRSAVGNICAGGWVSTGIYGEYQWMVQPHALSLVNSVFWERSSPFQPLFSLPRTLEPMPCIHWKSKGPASQVFSRMTRLTQ